MTQTKEKTFEDTLLEYRTLWNREQFLQHINLSWNTATKILLYDPRFQEDLKAFVHYPDEHNNKWLFCAEPMREYLKANFNEIFNKHNDY
ncbi:DUF771 domain-containing protein [Staphylococcus aureus]|uniref:DUF771 domain-containing protein n=1 Tax=Staphylococcus aureus TaxID=1280 RepID=UPI0018896F57|nr:DUF771 domain-containing protein [Staphylococcus aureus]MBF2706238.1 DUF771 domain-containing protein [Staphylococcus aureus]MBF2722792.1 DUF771 domain-containing protein [Staphylococcus aureus]MBU6092602.1 DUF771 domain-containing protein [Staphylococcus aureus]MBU7224571.1 DUF771 domain-containing protein [Staphylococcus aureus]MBU7280353.1 DUF771 domain-containing protein [Staphylococcus aureus]